MLTNRFSIRMIIISLIALALIITGCSSATQTGPPEKLPVAKTGTKSAVSSNSGIKKVPKKPDRSPSGVTPKTSIAKKRQTPKTKKAVSTGFHENMSEFIGQWLVVDSTAIFNIFRKKNRLVMRGYDSVDNEPFQFYHLNWKNDYIQGAMQMKSTKHRLEFNLYKQDTNTLRCAYGGDSIGAAIWKRK